MIKVTMNQDEKTGRKYYGPCLYCDFCERQITVAELAIYKWRDDEHGAPIEEACVILHKGKCDQMHEHLHRNEKWHWNEATTLLALLINNAMASDSQVTENLWAYLVEHYCPDAQLSAVENVASRILRDTRNRPPSVNDLPY